MHGLPMQVRRADALEHGPCKCAVRDAALNPRHGVLVHHPCKVHQDQHVDDDDDDTHRVVCSLFIRLLVTGGEGADEEEAQAGSDGQHTQAQELHDSQHAVVLGGVLTAPERADVHVEHHDAHQVGLQHDHLLVAGRQRVAKHLHRHQQQRLDLQHAVPEAPAVAVAREEEAKLLLNPLVVQPLPVAHDHVEAEGGDAQAQEERHHRTHRHPHASVRTRVALLVHVKSPVAEGCDCTLVSRVVPAAAVSLVACEYRESCVGPLGV
mmetsp:Transcript_36669/g.81598  ORF Transcript_36669/g.81598 Transcript_36669/m.81598 type:complete len:265 (+) Transcript_36669:482-1276(+)